MVGEHPGNPGFCKSELPFKVVEPLHNDFTTGGNLHIRGQEQFHGLGGNGDFIPAVSGQGFKGQLAGLIFKKRLFLEISQVGGGIGGFLLDIHPTPIPPHPFKGFPVGHYHTIFL